MARDYNYDIMPEMKTRYATRAFSERAVEPGKLMAAFEGARYAPSCFNEQPWRYIVGNADETHEKLAALLAPGNAWAKLAPVLVLICCTKNFKLNGNPNPFARFDTGQSVGFLQLEAVRQGFAVHCMSGFDAKKAVEVFSLPEDIGVIAMMALGYPGDIEKLPPDIRAKEAPGERNPLEEMFL